MFISKTDPLMISCSAEALDGLGLRPVMKLLQEWGPWPVVATSLPDWDKLADIIAEFGVQFIFSIQSLPLLENTNTTALYVSMATHPGEHQHQSPVCKYDHTSWRTPTPQPCM